VDTSPRQLVEQKDQTTHLFLSFCFCLSTGSLAGGLVLVNQPQGGRWDLVASSRHYPCRCVCHSPAPAIRTERPVHRNSSDSNSVVTLCRLTKSVPPRPSRCKFNDLIAHINTCMKISYSDLPRSLGFRATATKLSTLSSRILL
jgi:hypothetical protein